MVSKSDDAIAMEHASSLAQLFHSATTLHPKQTALVIESIALSYEQLNESVRLVAALLESQSIKRLGVLASRSVEAYVGILAAHWVGAAYVPLHPDLPMLRLNTIAEQAEIDALIVDEASLPLLKEFNCNPSLLVIAPCVKNHDGDRKFIFKDKADIQAITPIASVPKQPHEKDLAYLMFTSGSTGKPKGVPISFGNLACFISVIKNRYSLTTDDRVSQFSNLSFDVAIFDMVLAWQIGASLHVVPKHTLLAPAKFILDHAITVWLAVPSTIHMMNMLHMLKPNHFPSVKYSLFTGEVLTKCQVMMWQCAAPNSQIENLYGPTEATIDCIAYTVNETMEDSCHHDRVPIGQAFKGTNAALITPEKQFLSAGNKGELVLSGKQIVQGYWKDSTLSSQKFVKLHHPLYGEQVWYLTGDYCYQDLSEIFHYLYRLDNQYKILGNRIELEEIEYYLRKVLKSEEAAVIIISSQDHAEPSIIAVVTEPAFDSDEIKQNLHEYLPIYMMPNQVIYVDALPRNHNGKLDRKLLKEMLFSKLGIVRGESEW